MSGKNRTSPEKIGPLVHPDMSGKYGTGPNLVNRSRPNWITGLGPKSEPAGKSESRSPEKGVSRWRRPNSDIYSQNHQFGLVYDMIYQFLGMEAKNYFANNAIHPWPHVMPIFDRETPPGFTPAICLLRNFVYISNLENQGDKSLDQNF